MSCCAPCSAGAIAELKLRTENSELIAGEFSSQLSVLSSQLSDFIVLFYNPNIFPESEYQKRLGEQIKYCESLGVKYAICGADNYEPEHKKWLNCMRGLEDEPERGARCSECFKMRFEFGARWAREHGYNAIASVFGVSRHKNQKQVDEAARMVVGAHNCVPLPRSGNKVIAPGGATGHNYVPLQYFVINWNESLRQKINKASEFYRQNYCGCEYSRIANNL